jgi:1-acyl-sn-glycerol-3-phosphate acyltransferase
LLQFFDEPLYILKRELTWLPFFGWYLLKAGMIGVNRSAGGRTLIDITKRAAEEIRRGRQLLIYPEGTRRAVGAPPAYRNGVSLMYNEAGVPCIPVALNSGLFWPRRTFLRYPGTIVIEFLDPIPPGLPRQEFAPRLQAVIEEASDRLAKAGREEQVRLIGFPPVVASADPEAVSGVTVQCALAMQQGRETMQRRVAHALCFQRSHGCNDVFVIRPIGAVSLPYQS